MGAWKSTGVKDSGAGTKPISFAILFGDGPSVSRPSARGVCSGGQREKREREPKVDNGWIPLLEAFYSSKRARSVLEVLGTGKKKKKEMEGLPFSI